jgi:hypothetical protein
VVTRYVGKNPDASIEDVFRVALRAAVWFTLRKFTAAVSAEGGYFYSRLYQRTLLDEKDPWHLTWEQADEIIKEQIKLREWLKAIGRLVGLEQAVAKKVKRNPGEYDPNTVIKRRNRLWRHAVGSDEKAGDRDEEEDSLDEETWIMSPRRPTSPLDDYSDAYEADDDEYYDVGLDAYSDEDDTGLYDYSSEEDAGPDMIKIFKGDFSSEESDLDESFPSQSLSNKAASNQAFSEQFSSEEEVGAEEVGAEELGAMLL